MGLFSRALAGGIAAGSESLSKSITAQEEAAKQEARDRATRAHAEHMEELRQKFQTKQADIEYGRKDSDMVDKATGKKLTNEQLKTADQSSIMSSASWEAEQKKLNTAIGFNKKTGLPVYAGDKYDPSEVDLTSEMTKKEFDAKIKKYEADVRQSDAAAGASRAAAEKSREESLDEKAVAAWLKANPGKTEMDAIKALSEAKAAGKVGRGALTAKNKEAEAYLTQMNSAEAAINKALFDNPEADVSALEARSKLAYDNFVRANGGTTKAEPEALPPEAKNELRRQLGISGAAYQNTSPDEKPPSDDKTAPKAGDNAPETEDPVLKKAAELKAKREAAKAGDGAGQSPSPAPASEKPTEAPSTEKKEGGFARAAGRLMSSKPGEVNPAEAVAKGASKIAAVATPALVEASKLVGKAQAAWWETQIALGKKSVDDLEKAIDDFKAGYKEGLEKPTK